MNEMVLNSIELIIGVYFLWFGLVNRASNWQSATIYKFVPFCSGLYLVLLSVYHFGWFAK